jgi:hypothetical protein
MKQKILKTPTGQLKAQRKYNKSRLIGTKTIRITDQALELLRSAKVVKINQTINDSDRIIWFVNQAKKLEEMAKQDNNT